MIFHKFLGLVVDRYPYLFGSDERIFVCMSELGVPLTKELGFHQVQFGFHFSFTKKFPHVFQQLTAIAIGPSS